MIFLARQIQTAQAAGLSHSQIAVDPGLGFAKKLFTKSGDPAANSRSAETPLPDFGRAVTQKFYRVDFE